MMLTSRPYVFATFIVLLVGFATNAANAQDKKAQATIKLLIPELPTKTFLKIDGKDVDVAATKDGDRMFITPQLEPGTTYQYKIEARIVPNNYTEIFRIRNIVVKAGEELTLDLAKKDGKIKDDVRVRWVPTPESVVRDMCELAKIGKEDIVMDPGCGDAIMIITAVRDYQAMKGKGIDIDQSRVKESQKSVEMAGLKDKIMIKEGDALKLTAEDLGDVTVLMLYMGNELNSRLRPLLWEHLRPGSRIVSHRFIMDDWKPDKTIKVTHEDEFEESVEEFTLHVWSVTGKEKMGNYPKIDPETIDE
ncbi:MAG: TIGR03000 domain-containing protein [Planctomycetota bacterium]|nr:TIGR03000 domain-containing protein [Planctomycetota bacterium]